jgi:hypothetical protein
MLFLFHFSFSEFRPPDSNSATANPRNSVSLGHAILSVIPNWTNAGTRRDVYIKFSPPNPRIRFCRFGTAVVPGFPRENGRLRCEAPAFQAGAVQLSISEDGVNFVGDAVFTIRQKGASVAPYVILGAGVGLVVAFVFIGAKGKRPPPGRLNRLVQTRTPRKRRHEPAAFL